jgi:hypothetical protein
MNEEALRLLRLLVASYLRENLKLNQVFALDQAKEFLKRVDKAQATATMPRPTCGDGHRVSGFSSPAGNQGASS